MKPRDRVAQGCHERAQKKYTCSKRWLSVFLSSFVTTVRSIPYFSRISTDTKLVSSRLPTGSKFHFSSVRRVHTVGSMPPSTDVTVLISVRFFFGNALPLLFSMLSTCQRTTRSTPFSSSCHLTSALTTAHHLIPLSVKSIAHLTCAASPV